MRVLVLSYSDSCISSVIQSEEDNVLVWTEPIDVSFLQKNKIDFIISYGYRHIMSAPVIGHLRDHIINLHISYLPWNRGADPNLWSFLENTPKGVTIHVVDEGIDTGDIIAQKEMSFHDEWETLYTTYQKLQDAMISLFAETWPRIRSGAYPRHKQPEGGSFHKLADKRQFEHLLQQGWKTPVIKLKGVALRNE